MKGHNAIDKPIAYLQTSSDKHLLTSQVVPFDFVNIEVCDSADILLAIGVMKR